MNEQNKTQPQPETAPQAKTEPQAKPQQAQPQNQPQAKPQTKVQQAQPKIQPQPKLQPETAPQPKPQAKPEPQAKADPQQKPQSQPAQTAPAQDDLIIDMHGIVKRFYVGTPSELEILHGMDLQVRRGEFVAVVGASGSGKSTLMNIIGALDRPTEGTYYLDGVNVEKQGDRQLSKIRCAKIGFVFQTFNLVPRTNAIKNVELPMMYAGMSGFERTRRAKELLEMVEMSERAHHQPNELSGGQKQRVAIARSMANDPAIILADEPTGALDSKTGRLVMDLFHRLHEEQGKTIVLITHSKELAEECGRVVTISDGNVVDVRPGMGRPPKKGGDANAAV